MHKRDAILLSDFRVDCIVGILPSERVTPQPLLIDLQLFMDVERAAAGDLDKSINYAAVMEQVTALACGGRWRLIESLATAICSFVLARPCPGERRARVQAVEVMLRKPTILAGLAVPGVRMYREQSWAKLPRKEAIPGVVIETVHKTADAAAFRCHLKKGATWALTPHAQTYVISGSVAVRDGIMENLGDTIASVLVCGMRESPTGR
jgi:dihydroneopterin aldolase